MTFLCILFPVAWHLLPNTGRFVETDARRCSCNPAPLAVIALEFCCPPSPHPIRTPVPKAIVALQSAVSRNYIQFTIQLGLFILLQRVKEAYQGFEERDISVGNATGCGLDDRGSIPTS
jgi:hypothetical protein